MRGSGAQLVEYALIVVMKAIVFFTVIFVIGYNLNIDVDMVKEFTSTKKEVTVEKMSISDIEAVSVSQKEANEITQIVNKAIKDISRILK